MTSFNISGHFLAVWDNRSLGIEARRSETNSKVRVKAAAAMVRAELQKLESDVSRRIPEAAHALHARRNRAPTFFNNFVQQHHHHNQVLYHHHHLQHHFTHRHSIIPCLLYHPNLSTFHQRSAALSATNLKLRCQAMTCVVLVFL